MTEQGRIKYNIKGEKPSKPYDIVRVRNIPNAKEVLDNFKNAILIFLQNKNLSDESDKWEKLLPEGIVNKINQFDDYNYKYDEVLKNINMSIYSLQDFKRWKWFSSLEVEHGFDIIVEGEFNPGRFINFIHCQNVPLKNIKIIDEQKGEIYDIRTLKDYTTYKTLE